MKITKSVEELVEELREVAYEYEKLAYNRPNFYQGHLVATWVMALGLDGNFGKNQIKHRLQMRIDEYKKDIEAKMSEVSDKVEL